MARILRDILLVTLILLTAGLVIVRLDEAGQASLAGRPRVIDGDTLVLGAERIRLSGIDAPELRQVCRRDESDWPCGTVARDHLAGLIGDADMRCKTGGDDRYGRRLATCIADGRDLNAAMVRAGHALAFGGYEAEEEAARSRKLGLWAGTFDAPRTWRRTHGGMEEAPHIVEDWLDAIIARAAETTRTILAGWWNG
jgi:endonuclease YncB( thermonuclease family)